MWILGINAPPSYDRHHDPSACLIDGDGRVTSLVEEERISRRKYGINETPANAARRCLEMAQIDFQDIDVIAVGWDVPLMHANAGHKWDLETTREYIAATLTLDIQLPRIPETVFVPHHLAHAASSFYASGFDKAGVIVLDGNGELESGTIFKASFHNASLVPVARLDHGQSLGWLYDAACRTVGMSHLDAGKLMGLSAYGRAQRLEPVSLFESASQFPPRPPFELGASPTYSEVIKAWQIVFASRGLAKVRAPVSQLAGSQTAIRLAWSAQSAIEDALHHLVAFARRELDIDALCLAGGLL